LPHCFASLCYHNILLFFFALSLIVGLSHCGYCGYTASEPEPEPAENTAETPPIVGENVEEHATDVPPLPAVRICAQNLDAFVAHSRPILPRFVSLLTRFRLAFARVGAQEDPALQALRSAVEAARANGVDNEIVESGRSVAEAAAMEVELGAQLEEWQKVPVASKEMRPGMEVLKEAIEQAEGTAASTKMLERYVVCNRAAP
jgi:hypothetical protein